MHKNTKYAVLLPIILALAIITGLLLGGVVFRTASITENNQVSRRLAPGSEKLNLTLSLINQKYVDPVNIDSLTENVIPLLLKELDPHSSYIPAQDFPRISESLEGEFEGIGVTFNMLTDTVLVINVIPGGPSSKAGIQAGDRIVTIGGRNTAGIKMDQDSVVKMLRGPRGSKVDLGLQRLGVDELVPVTVTRGVIPIFSILASHKVNPTTGYVMFSQFSRNSYMEITEAFAKLKAQGASKIILDMRGNVGGFLDQAIYISNMFLPKERLIVYTQDRNGNQTKQYTDGEGMFKDIEMVLLIDEQSASSSEILAGALQDNDRCLIIGRRSFGKGLVQERIPFSDGSALQLTISRYYTPSGRSIQKPYDNGIDEYHMDIYNRYQHNEFFSADSIHFADTTKYHTHSGRVVYGGGGIMPDIFVPADTTYYTPYMREVSGKNIIYRFSINFSDRHRAELNSINSIETLEAFFAKNRGMFDQFIAYAAREGVAPDYKDIALSRDVITAQLEGYIGRNTPLEEDAFYYALNKVDNTVLKALEVLESEDVLAR